MACGIYIIRENLSRIHYALVCQPVLTESLFNAWLALPVCGMFWARFWVLKLRRKEFCYQLTMDTKWAPYPCWGDLASCVSHAAGLYGVGLLEIKGHRDQFMFRKDGTGLDIWYELAKTWLMLDILGALSQHKMANPRSPGNPKVNNEVIVYITIFGLMPLLCEFCMHITLKSETLILIGPRVFDFPSLPVCVCLRAHKLSVACVPVYMYACTCLCVACVCQRVPRCLLEAACLATCEPMNKTCLVGPQLFKISLTSWPPVTVLLSRYQSSDLTHPWALGTCALVCCEIPLRSGSS